MNLVAYHDLDHGAFKELSCKIQIEYFQLMGENEMSTAMDEQQMLLIMKYYDGECSEVEVLHAERLLRESNEAGFVMEKFSSLGGMIEEWGHTVQSRTRWVPDVNAIMEEVDLRQRSSARLMSTSELETRLASSGDARLRGNFKSHNNTFGLSFIGRIFENPEARGLRVKTDTSRGFDFWHGLGWVSSGALVAASLVLLFGISGNFSYFNRNGYNVADSDTQSAGVKVVSAEGLITGGDKGSAGTSFVNEHGLTPRITQPLVGPWDQSDGTNALFEEMKEIEKDKKHLEDEKEKLTHSN